MELKSKKFAKINKQVLKFYVEELEKSKEVKKYVHSRISPEITKKRFLGFCPRKGFIEFLNSIGVSSRTAIHLGLVSVDLDGYARSRFANRVVVPIIHARRVLGFGGRVLDNGLPKYLNSRNSVLYNKSSALYGLPFARKAIENLGFSFVVEGYFDVLTLASFGINNCVALCGTAISKNQVSLLKRYTDNICIMMDPDQAGQDAARRVRKVAKSSNMKAVNLVLPGSLDPAEFVSKHGSKKLVKITEKKIYG